MLYVGRDDCSFEIATAEFSRMFAEPCHRAYNSELSESAMQLPRRSFTASQRTVVELKLSFAVKMMGQVRKTSINQFMLRVVKK